VILDLPESKDLKNIRIYDPARVAAAKAAVKNYKTFDAYPELILYEGWFNKKNGKLEIHEIKSPQPKAA